MGGIATGFTVIAIVIGIGYVLGLTGVLGEGGQHALNKLAFHIATPALMFQILAGADLAVLTSSSTSIIGVTTFAMAGIYSAIGAVCGWGIGRTTVGALCASFVNSGNLGIPIAVYVLGDAGLVAPVMLLQQVVVVPLALSILGIRGQYPNGPKPSLLACITLPFRNLIVIGSFAGVVVSVSGWTVPEPIMQPIILIGGMSVPAMLLAFGLSLRGSGVGRGGDPIQLLISVGLKSLVHPALAWMIGANIFHLTGTALFSVVVLAALPTAQQIFTFASEYKVGVSLARESIVFSTVASVPALVVVALFLG